MFEVCGMLRGVMNVGHFENQDPGLWRRRRLGFEDFGTQAGPVQESCF